MSTLDLFDVRNEISHFLRAYDALSTSIRGVTRTALSYTVGVGGEATHALTAPLRDVHTLTVNSTAKYFLRDYTYVDSTGVLTWNTPLVENDSVVFSYDHGSGDKVFPDLPRDDLTLQSFPRVGIELTSMSTQPLGLGGMTHISDLVMTVIVWAPVNQDSNIAGGYGGTTDLNDTITTIRGLFRTYAKSFYTFQFITPVSVGPMIKGQNGKIVQMTADFRIKNIVE